MEKRHTSEMSFRVVDQSNRRWAYGFIRMAPAMMYVGGIVLIVLILALFPSIRFVGLILAPIVVVVPIVIDRSALLDPVDYVNFGEFVMVKRLVKQRSHSLDRIKQIEFTAPPGEDYDDQHTGKRCMEVTIRIDSYWPARILATISNTIMIDEWAKANRVRIVKIGNVTLVQP